VSSVADDQMMVFRKRISARIEASIAKAVVDD
jgi:hypothetical protein